MVFSAGVVSVLLVEAVAGFTIVVFFFFEDFAPGPGILVQLTVEKPNNRKPRSNKIKTSDRTE